MAFLDEIRRITRPYEDGEDYIENEPVEEYSGQEEPYEAPVEQTAPTRSVFGRREAKAAPAEAKPSNQKPVLAVPNSYDDGADIVMNLRDKRTVFVNIENLDRDTARRLLDFLSGATYALNGNVKRFSEKAYIITFTGIDQIGSAADVFENGGFYF